MRELLALFENEENFDGGPVNGFKPWQAEQPMVIPKKLRFSPGKNLRSRRQELMKIMYTESNHLCVQIALFPSH